MQANWEDPFGAIEIIEPVNGIGRVFRTEAGVLTTRHIPDIAWIKDEQKRLLPHFDRLNDAANDILARTQPLAGQLSLFDIYPSVLYRNPDYPGVLNGLRYPGTARAVPVDDDGTEVHPLIDALFPVQRFSEMSLVNQRALKASRQISFHANITTWNPRGDLRFVFPELIGFIKHWICSVDAPLNDLSYIVRPRQAERGSIAFRRTPS